MKKFHFKQFWLNFFLINQTRFESNFPTNSSFRGRNFSVPEPELVSISIARERLLIHSNFEHRRSLCWEEVELFRRGSYVRKTPSKITTTSSITATTTTTIVFVAIFHNTWVWTLLISLLLRKKSEVCLMCCCNDECCDAWVNTRARRQCVVYYVIWFVVDWLNQKELFSNLYSLL